MLAKTGASRWYFDTIHGLPAQSLGIAHVITEGFISLVFVPLNDNSIEMFVNSKNVYDHIIPLSLSSHLFR